MRSSSSQHEALVELAVAKAPSDRAFGLTVGGILLVIVAVRVALHGAPDTVDLLLGAPGAALIIAALVAAPRLGALNRLWMRFALLLARIVNPLVMLLLFALAFVPTGLIMRALGHDPLRRRRQGGAATYWIPRPADGRGTGSMRNQF